MAFTRLLAHDEIQPRNFPKAAGNLLVAAERGTGMVVHANQIQEEIQRANKSSEPSTSEAFGSLVTHVKQLKPEVNSADDWKFRELERQIMDLKIANRGKDYLIDQLKSERSGFFERLLTANRKVGQLETKLNQLDVPKT